MSSVAYHEMYMYRRCLSQIVSSARQMSTSASSSSDVALVQMCSNHDVGRNLDISSRVIRRAVAAGAKAVFLPEAADFIATSDQQCRALSSPLSRHQFTLGLQDLAKELQVYIAAGVHEVPEDAEETSSEKEDSLRVYNTHVLIGTDGNLITRYRKTHLFDIALKQPLDSNGREPPPRRTGESIRIRPGNEIVGPQTLGSIGKVGLEICYDLRFPEMHAILTRQGADVLVIPSAFTLKTGKDHWETLIRATAIQYQVYVLAPAQYGAHNASRSSWGETLAFDPWGIPLGRLRSVEDGDAQQLYDKEAEFLLIPIDSDRVTETREQIPLNFQKRVDLYGVVGQNV